MIRFFSHRNDGSGGGLYGFGLTEVNLNRLEFNEEPILFDFGYAGHPEVFGLIQYLGEFEQQSDIGLNLDAVRRRCLPFLAPERGITIESVRAFPLSRGVMRDLREKWFWGFEASFRITSPNDLQIIFAGPDEQAIEGI